MQNLFVKTVLLSDFPPFTSKSATFTCVHSLISELHEIIFQVARNEIEEGEIRSQALEALVDMASVYENIYQNHSALTMFLHRLQEGAEPALLRVGAEGSAKLLFSGRLSEPKLFANLLKFFFLPELAGTSGMDGYDGEEGDDVAVEDAFLGSSSRLQQVLSVFFQSFFVVGESRDGIAFLCVSDLVADLAMLVRDGQVAPSAMTKVMKLRVVCVLQLVCRVMLDVFHPYHYTTRYVFHTSHSIRTYVLHSNLTPVISSLDIEPFTRFMRQYQAAHISSAFQRVPLLRSVMSTHAKRLFSIDFLHLSLRTVCLTCDHFIK